MRRKRGLHLFLLLQAKMNPQRVVLLTPRPQAMIAATEYLPCGFLAVWVLELEAEDQQDAEGQRLG